MTAIPTTQEEFEALMLLCYCCDRKFAERGDYPYQIAELARAGIEHRICDKCLDRLDRSSVLAKFVERCVALAVADARGVAK